MVAVKLTVNILSSWCRIPKTPTREQNDNMEHASWLSELENCTDSNSRVILIRIFRDRILSKLTEEERSSLKILDRELLRLVIRDAIRGIISESSDQ